MHALRQSALTRPFALAFALALCHPALAQRPILPICSDNAAYKLPPCTAPPDAPDNPAPSATPSPSNPAATQFPFPGGGNATDGSNSPDGSRPAPSSTTAPAEPSPADKFPFPGSAPATPAAPNAPATDAPSAKQPPSSAAFPFPGESVPLPVTDPNARVYDPKTDSDVPIHPAATPALPAAPAPDTSAPPPATPSSSSSSSDTPSLKDIGSEGSTPNSRRRMPKVEDLGAREEEDVKVAKYYHSTGNYQAAYNRAKDALKIDPKDSDAQLALAINAEELKKTDEAIAGYTAYLKLAPDGDDAKRAKKSLATLKPQ